MCRDRKRERERVTPMLFSAPAPLLNEVFPACFCLPDTSPRRRLLAVPE